jgi:hypothetical protein
MSEAAAQLDSEPHRESIPNHVPDPATGFLESNGFANAFDAPRKLAFLENYKCQRFKATPRLPFYGLVRGYRFTRFTHR